MTAAEAYELVDFGDGRKLEQFGPLRLDRPCPAAERETRADPLVWRDVAARYERRDRAAGRWRPARAVASPWTVDLGDFQLQLKGTPFGHVGMFPEQLGNWEWIFQRIARRRQPAPRVLNLFAYTGGGTLAAAAAGAHVVHVDSARNVVQWARENAQLSGFDSAPIRWITEDAVRFVRRELRRGNRYDAILLDPPSYGHGPQGQTWRLGSDLLPLLNACRRLLTESPLFLLLTCHSPGWDAASAGACVQEAIFGHCSSQVAARPLNLSTPGGRPLNAGVVVRWPA